VYYVYIYIYIYSYLYTHISTHFPHTCQMFPHSVLLELILLTMLSDDLQGLPNAELPFSIILEKNMGYVTYQVRCYKTHFL
jgi:hypothetical protein